MILTDMKRFSLEGPLKPPPPSACTPAHGGEGPRSTEWHFRSPVLGGRTGSPLSRLGPAPSCTSTPLPKHVCETGVLPTNLDQKSSFRISPQSYFGLKTHRGFLWNVQGFIQLLPKVGVPLRTFVPLTVSRTCANVGTQDPAGHNSPGSPPSPSALIKVGWACTAQRAGPWRHKKYLRRVWRKGVPFALPGAQGRTLVLHRDYRHCLLPPRAELLPLPTAGQPGATCRSSWAWNHGLGGLCRFLCPKSSQLCTWLFFLPVWEQLLTCFWISNRDVLITMYLLSGSLLVPATT